MRISPALREEYVQTVRINPPEHEIFPLKTHSRWIAEETADPVAATAPAT